MHQWDATKDDTTADGTISNVGIAARHRRLRGATRVAKAEERLTVFPPGVAHSHGFDARPDLHLASERQGRGRHLTDLILSRPPSSPFLDESVCARV